jgi:hypothetical protein
MARLRLALPTALKEALRSHWFHVPFQSVGVLLCAYWYWRPPIPNKAVLAIGVVAVIMTLSEMTPSHKALWLAIVFALAFIENRAIDKERKNSEQERAEIRRKENEQFQGIANGINRAIDQSQRGFDATMNRSDKVMATQGRELNGITKTLNTFTGSESYVYLNYIPTQGFLFFAHQGDYPLYGVTARIVDLDQLRTNLLGTVVSVGDMIKGHGVMRPIPDGLPLQGDHFDANIFFNARNGDWVEKLRTRKTKDGWARAIRVEGLFTTLKKEKPMCETIDPQIQLDSDGEVEKDWTPDPKLPRCQ